jgi:hypothetical protein
VGGYVIDKATIDGKELKKDSYSVDSVYEKYLTFYDDNGKEISPDCLTVKASSGMKIEPDTVYYKVTGIKKAGKYTITAKTKDGNDTKKYEFEVTPGWNEDYDVMFFDGYNNPIEMKMRKATVKNSSLIVVKAVRVSDPFDYAGTLTVKGGKIVSSFKGYDGSNQMCTYVIKPTAKVIEPTFKFGKGAEERKWTYSITNEQGTLASLKTAKGSTTTFTGGNSAMIPVEFSFAATDVLPSGATYNLAFQLDESFYKSKKETAKESYRVLQDALNNAGEDAQIQDPSKPQVFGTHAALYNSILPGTYKFYVTVVKADDGTPMTKPALIKFTARSPKKLKAKLKTNPAVILDKNGKSGCVDLASSSAYSSVRVTALYNNNNKGQINNFRELFTVEPEGGRFIIKRTETPYRGGFDRKGKATIIGWIEYEVTGEDGKEKLTKTEKVTITLMQNVG